MRRPIKKVDVLRDLEGVADKLANGGLTGERRLALLRRQAELGDLRDDMTERARRAAAAAGA